MTNRKSLYLLVLCAAVFAASFWGTLAARSQTSSEGEPYVASPLARWLELDKSTDEEIERHDPQFAEERAALQQELAEARSTLAKLLESDGVTDEQIRQQVETCIAVHNRLERRVADYLLAVRDHLTPAQQKKLFRLCAEGVRKGRGRGWGRGAGRGGGERCECCGRGGGRGRGRAHDHVQDD